MLMMIPLTTAMLGRSHCLLLVKADFDMVAGEGWRARLSCILNALQQTLYLALKRLYTLQRLLSWRSDHGLTSE